MRPYSSQVLSNSTEKFITTGQKIEWFIHIAWFARPSELQALQYGTRGLPVGIGEQAYINNIVSYMIFLKNKHYFVRNYRKYL